MFSSWTKLGISNPEEERNHPPDQETEGKPYVFVIIPTSVHKTNSDIKYFNRMILEIEILL